MLRCRLMSHVFISYVRDDSARVDELARDLRRAGVEVWLDREQLRAGQRWRDAIRDAIRSGALFVACFSRASARRARTHMNAELVVAVEELQLRAADRAWFVSVLLDDGEVPARSIGAGETLHDLQWVDLAANWSAGVAAIALAAKQSDDRAGREQHQDQSTGGTVATSPLPTITSATSGTGDPGCDISLSPGTIRRGESANLLWSSTNAAKAEVTPGLGYRVAPSGSITVWPQVTTRYTIRVANDAGVQAEATATIYVVEHSFSGERVGVAGSLIATPDTISPGEFVHLKWNSLSATQVIITPEIGPVPTEGAVAVSPLVTTTYTLMIANSEGGYGEGSATVYVRAPEPSASGEERDGQAR